MREARSPRHYPVRPERSRGAPGPGPAPSERATNYSPAGPAGEASVEQVELDAAAAWLAHVEAGRIG